MRARPLGLVIALALGQPGVGCLAGEWRGGIGVLGDSYSDEYQFYPPHRSRARNWVEILAETRPLNFGSFSLSDRGIPRHAGYAYNWARSGATTTDALVEGQHTGLAAQVARGEVEVVWLFIGGNDFIEALRLPDPDAELGTTADRAIANLDTIVATLRAADPGVLLMVATVPDVLEVPEFAIPLREGSLPKARAAALRAALLRFNEHIRGLPSRDEGIVLVDLFLSRQITRMLDPGGLKLAGRRIRDDQPGDQYDRLFLADGRHAGSVAQAMMARLFVAALNARLNAGVAPLGDREILDYVARVAPAPAEIAGGGPVPSAALLGEVSAP